MAVHAPPTVTPPHEIRTRSARRSALTRTYLPPIPDLTFSPPSPSLFLPLPLPPPSGLMCVRSYNMDVPPGVRAYEYANRLPASAAAAMLQHDFEFGNGSLTLRQVHAHAHRHATKVSLHLIRGDEQTTLLSLSPYCGYGPCQHFHDLPPGTTFRLGDGLELRCVYENDEPLSLTYGLSQMQEMCGPIVVYTPHDSRRRPTKEWYDSNAGRERPRAGTGEWTLSAPGDHFHPGRPDFPEFSGDQR